MKQKLLPHAVFPIVFVAWFSALVPTTTLAQSTNACEYLDEASIGAAIGKPVKSTASRGDTQKYEGFVLHMCGWSVPGSQFGTVSLMLREAPTKSLNEQGIREMKSSPPKQGLRTEHFTGLGDFAEYAHWETEDRAGITVLKGTKTINITVTNAGRFGAKHKSAFVTLASKVVAKY